MAVMTRVETLLGSDGLGKTPCCPQPRLVQGLQQAGMTGVGHFRGGGFHLETFFTDPKTTPTRHKRAAEIQTGSGFRPLPRHHEPVTSGR